jgi:hypothetical protein
MYCSSGSSAKVIAGERFYDDRYARSGLAVLWSKIPAADNRHPESPKKRGPTCEKDGTFHSRSLPVSLNRPSSAGGGWPGILTLECVPLPLNNPCHERLTELTPGIAPMCASIWP